jgi:hypothetical protein
MQMRKEASDETESIHGRADYSGAAKTGKQGTDDS